MGKVDETGVLLRGGMIIVGFYLLAAMLHLNTITWIINHMGQLVLTALIIIFQPELRKSAGAARKAKTSITDLFIYREIPDSQEGDIRKRLINESQLLPSRWEKVKDRSADRDRARHSASGDRANRDPGGRDRDEPASDQYFLSIIRRFTMERSLSAETV